MKKDTQIIIGICIILLLASGILFCWQQESSAGFHTEPAYTEDDVSLPTDRAPDDTGQEQAGGEETSECAVYVSGAVKNPGLFRYYGTARVSDAIQASGGFSKGADRNAVNLARLLSDGEQIQVPTKKETAKATESVAGGSTIENRQGVNINTASLEELMTLPGIGQAKAEAVIAYRTEHGSFTKKEDIMNISGIKEGVYNKIKDFIVIT